MKEKRQALLFFDESGNTGTNWLDQNQPYYVYGGWLVLEDVYTDQTEHTARRFSAWLPPIQCTLSGHQCMMLIQG